MKRLAMVFLIIGTLLLPVGAIGHWAWRTFTDTDRYVATVAPLTESPAVQQGIADAVTGSLITPEGAAAQVQEWFPKAPTGLVNTVSQAVVSKVNELVKDAVATEQFSQLWATANTDVQKAAIALLQDEPPPSLSVVDGNLVLNLNVVKDSVRTRVQQQGINLPDLNLEAPTITLIEGTQVEQIRGIYAWAAPLARFFILIPIGLLIAYVVMTRNIRRLGYGVLIASGLMALFLMGGDGLLANSLQGTAFEPAESDIWDALTVNLARGAWAFFLIGAVLIIVGFFVGPKKEIEEVVVEEVVVEQS
jgi:hypothetical protein